MVDGGWVEGRRKQKKVFGKTWHDTCAEASEDLRHMKIVGQPKDTYSKIFWG